MRHHRLPAVTGVLLLAALAAACDTAPSGPAVVTATILDDGTPVPGATMALRLLNESAATAVTDSTGHIRLELADAEGPGLLEFARDADPHQPPPDPVFAPLLLEPGGSARVVLDLAADRGHQARYMTATRMARWGRAAQTIMGIEHDHYAAYNAWVAGGQEGEFEVDLSDAAAWVRAALRGEDDPEVRAALWAALLTAGARGDSVTVREAEQALSEIPPGAAIWRWRAHSVVPLARYAATVAEGAGNAAADSAAGQELAGRRELAVRRADAYVDRVIDAFEGTETQAEVLHAAVMYAALTRRNDEAFAYFDRLETTHPDSRWTERARSLLPNLDIAIDAPVPDVPLPALDSAAPPITPDQLAGPATLVDFWAAWCTPCVAEMPAIHEAYERFHESGFDVVSISFDDSPEDVAAFRDRYPMPWRHAFVGADNLSDGEVAAAWGVHGLPAAFLVGPDGTIIALEGELRGDRLAETLERVLGS